jgi:uncharacterized membrane protein
MTPRQYKLFLTRTQKASLVIPIALFTILPVIFFVVFSHVPPSPARGTYLPPYFPWFPLGFFFIFAAIFGWYVMSMPFEITVTHDKMLVFRSFLKSTTVRPGDVTSIEPRSMRMKLGISGYQLTHLNGKVLYPGQFTGMYLLLAELKQVNPSMEIKGC